MLGGDGAGEFVLVLVEQVQEAVHQPGTANGGRIGPGRKGGLGGGDGGAHIIAGGQRHAAAHIAGGRVVDVLRAPVGTRDTRAADEVLDLVDGHAALSWMS